MANPNGPYKLVSIPYAMISILLPFLQMNYEQKKKTLAQNKNTSCQINQQKENKIILEKNFNKKGKIKTKNLK